ncbi:MAG TPA: methyltransferase domain-containing protein [Gemmatimonadales bacterium]|jgi:ubiquinone/menaquinone biosynthesis C-methylase UbiE
MQRYGWDRAAEVYERSWQRQLAPAQQRLLELAAICPGEQILDVACGTGLVTFPAAQCAGSGGFVLATDLSDEMVERVNREAVRRGMNHVHAQRVAAEEIATPDQPFDVALCALGLMYITDPAAVLRAMHSALWPGGRAIVAVWGARERCGWSQLFPIVDRIVRSEVCPLFFDLGDGDALRAAMQGAGFIDIDVERIETILSYDSGDEACDAAFAGGPVALAYSHFDPPTRAHVDREYLRSLEAWRQGETYHVPAEFVVARGVRPGDYS